MRQTVTPHWFLRRSRRSRWALAVLALTILGIVGWPLPALAACSGQSFPCDWQFKRKLTFNNATVAENLVDFPVLVVLNSTRIDY
ncbi:MAG: hypothetical protein U1B94_08145, partial [candidate division NC10 bacterium]|nr:hypothetical protein [candidate division NC10 bacterium]